MEAQLTEAKHELSEQYKIQSSNAQRLLALTDTLREAEDRSRDERDELRRLRAEVEGLRERARWHKEVVAEKEKQLLVRGFFTYTGGGRFLMLSARAQILQDDHASLELELSQVTIQNENLKVSVLDACCCVSADWANELPVFRSTTHLYYRGGFRLRTKRQPG